MDSNFEFIIDNLYTNIFEHLDLADKLNVLSLNNKFTLIDYCFVVNCNYDKITSRPFQKKKIYPCNIFISSDITCGKSNFEIIQNNNLSIHAKININYEDFISWKNKPFSYKELNLFSECFDKDFWLENYNIKDLGISLYNTSIDLENKNKSLVNSKCENLFITASKRNLIINCKNLKKLIFNNCDVLDVHFGYTYSLLKLTILKKLLLIM